MGQKAPEKQAVAGYACRARSSHPTMAAMKDLDYDQSNGLRGLDHPERDFGTLWTL